VALTRHDARGFTLCYRTADRRRATSIAPTPFRLSPSSIFAEGAATLELVETHGNTIVLAMIERQHWKAGGLPDHDCHGA